jgi:hypothetical protein
MHAYSRGPRGCAALQVVASGGDHLLMVLLDQRARLGVQRVDEIALHLSPDTGAEVAFGFNSCSPDN